MYALTAMQPLLNRESYHGTKKMKHLGKVERIECRYCDKTFSMKYIRDRHERNKHLGVKNFNCDLCEEQFSISYQLKGHKRTKHRLDRLKCNSCQKTFSFQHSFKEHLDRCNNNEPEKHTCDTCDSKFTTKEH